MHIRGEARRGYTRKTQEGELCTWSVCTYIYIEVWDITERDYTQDKGEVPTDKRSTEWDILGDGTNPTPPQAISLFRLYACSKLTPPMSVSVCALSVTPSRVCALFPLSHLPCIFSLRVYTYPPLHPPPGGIRLLYVYHSPLCVFPRCVWVEGS